MRVEGRGAKFWLHVREEGLQQDRFKFSYLPKNDHYLRLSVRYLGSSDQHLRLTDHHLRLNGHHLNASGCLITCAQGRREGGNRQLRERNAHCQVGRRLFQQFGVLKYAMLCLYLAIIKKEVCEVTWYNLIAATRSHCLDCLLCKAMQVLWELYLYQREQ